MVPTDSIVAKVLETERRTAHLRTQVALGGLGTIVS